MLFKRLLPLAALGLVLVGWAKAPSAHTGYAIQNVATGKNLRPFQAGTADGNRLVLYDHHNWKCMTWQLQPVAAGAYQLRNLYTAKSFQPMATCAPGVALWQQPLQAGHSPAWEFTKQADDTYRIKLQGTELYVTTSAATTNSAIVLLPKQDSPSQLWRLVRQRPWF